LANKGNPNAPPMTITELTPAEEALAVSAPGTVSNPGALGNVNPNRPGQQLPRFPNTPPPPGPQF
jgi:hypothetical protein